MGRRASHQMGDSSLCPFSSGQTVPQTAYAGFIRCLQAKWKYLQRVVPIIGDAFAPVKNAIMDDFLPSLFGDGNQFHLVPLRELLAVPVQHAGLGIPNPTWQAAPSYAESKEMTNIVIQSLQENSDLSVALYLDSATRTCQANRAWKDGEAKTALVDLLQATKP